MLNTSVLTGLQPLQYTGIDYNTIIAEMTRILRDNPKWNEKWTGFSSSEASIMFSEFMAFIADNLAIKIDSMINEFFVSTASRDIDKIRLLRLINYTPRFANAAKLYATIELNSMYNGRLICTPDKPIAMPLSERVQYINYVIAQNSFNTNSRFEFLDINEVTEKPNYLSPVLLPQNNGSVLYETNDNGKDLILLQGQTKYIEFSSNSNDGPEFDIIDTNIALNSIMIYELNPIREHLEVRTFIQQEAMDETKPIPYVITLNENGTTRITYANTDIMTNVKRRFVAGKTIGVFYRVCDGISGNIPVRFLNQSLSLASYNGDIIDGTIYNDSDGFSGSDPEPFEKAVINGPLSIKTMDRAVTPEDYDIMINKYGMNGILQSKNFSATNIPEGFKQIYGRWINPQEVFSIVIPNKNFDTIPATEYNNYPWIFLKQHPMLNEQYVFDIAEYNILCNKSPIISELLVTEMNAPNGPRIFRNCSIITVNEAFASGIISSIDSTTGRVVPNPNMKLKLHTSTATNLKYFNDIYFSLLSDGWGNSFEDTKQYVIQSEPGLDPKSQNSSITVRTHAKFLSKDGFPSIGQRTIYDRNEDGEQVERYIIVSEPIDITQYNYLSMVIDDKNIINVYLKPTVNDGGWQKNIAPAGKPYWIYLSNTPYGTAETPLELTHMWAQGEKTDANYRWGLVELINQQLAQVIEKSYEKDDYYAMYGPYTSMQYLNINKNGAIAIMEVMASLIDEATKMTKAVVTINDEIYRFTFSKNLYTSAFTYYETFEPERVESLQLLEEGIRHYTMLGIALQIDFQLQGSPDLTGVPQNALTLEKWDATAGDFIRTNEALAGVRFDAREISQFTTDEAFNDIITAQNTTNYNYLLWDMVFYTYPDIENSDGVPIGTSGLYNHSYIKIGTSTVNNDYSLLHLLKDINDMTQTLILPDPQYAADYNNLATAETRSVTGQFGNILTQQYLQIISPLMGERSSIYFVWDKNLNVKPGDPADMYQAMFNIMNNVFSVKYDNRNSGSSTNTSFSDKAYGIRRITIFFENAVSTSYGDLTHYPDNVTQGQLIYEHNCIFDDIDIYNIYASYKLNSNDTILLGSVYNNFYYSGSSVIDSGYKPAVIGINGQFIEEIEYNNKAKRIFRINPNKSTFDVRFTQNKVATNSIYTITSDIDVIPIDVVSLPTDNLFYKEGQNFSGAANLVYTFDDQDPDHPFRTAFAGAQSRNDLYEIIMADIAKKAGDVYYDTYVNNKASLLSKSFDSRMGLVFHNLSKKEGGNITFYFDNGTNRNNQKTFVNLFGTSKTNPDFYELYGLTNWAHYEDPLDPRGELSNVQEWRPGPVDEFEGYVYVPTLEHPLVFTYKKVITKVNEDKSIDKIYRDADYYFDVVDSFDNVNGRPSQQVFLKKTEVSTFMDFPFYIHFVNNRQYELNQDGYFKHIEEDDYQQYMKNYKISGMDLSFLPPYFKPFEIEAVVEYNPSYSYYEVWIELNNVIATNYNITNMEIGKKLTKAKVFKDIMNVNGVENCTITYFGFDITDPKSSVDVLQCDFYQILCLRQDSFDQYNKPIRGKVFDLIQTQ